MKSKHKYIDNTLLSLKRQYSKDETIKAVFKKVEYLEMEIGILKSERDEAIYQKEEVLKLSSDEKSRIGQRQYYRNQIAEIKSLKKKLKECKIKYDRLFHKQTLSKIEDEI